VTYRIKYFFESASAPEEGGEVTWENYIG